MRLITGTVYIFNIHVCPDPDKTAPKTRSSKSSAPDSSSVVVYGQLWGRQNKSLPRSQRRGLDVEMMRSDWWRG